MRNSRTVLFDNNPGRNAQTVGIARELGTDIDLIHEPSVGVVGNKGDSQCYLGVQRKVEAIHDCLRSRIGQNDGQMRVRLVQPEYSVATSDGMRNGTREMRYSLIGREVTNDTMTAKIIELRNNKKSIRAIASEVGVSTATIQTPHSPQFLSDFPYETHPDIGGPVGPSVPLTRIEWGGHDERLDLAIV